MNTKVSREIKDYLQFYIGQDVMLTEPEAAPFKVKLTGFVTERADDEEMLRIQVCESDGPEGYEGRGIIWCDEEEIELILRPIENITEEEYQEINKYGFGGASTKEYWLNQFEKFEERPAFGQGKKSEVKNPKMVKNRVSKGLQLRYYTFAPESFTFLLSRGFDLFGLIDDGIAIDKTKQLEQ